MHTFPKDFFFGVSNAAGQVEDDLNDTWLAFAREGRVRRFRNVEFAEERLRFWTQPEVEINLAKELGVKVFRLSLAWERLCPAPGVWDEAAANRYLQILDLIVQSGIDVMLTLFHHVIPPWMQSEGGWTNPRAVEHFKFYSQRAFEKFKSRVTYWITLNEPVPWSYLTYCEGLFPPGQKGSWWQHQSALSHMARAHNIFFSFAGYRAQVGIAHHMGWHQGRGPVNKLLSLLSDHLTHWSFLKRIRRSMSFFGINYYGAEWMTPRGPAQYAELEFSDAGRAVSPLGLLTLLRKIYRRYQVPILVTENGVGDGTDVLRPAYLCEHLAALLKAISEGIPVRGYVHWTLSDNFEWSDGYGPKFGLVEVDRGQELKRIPRQSYYLYQQIIRDHGFTSEQREKAWVSYQQSWGSSRPYWRGDNGKEGRDEAHLRHTPAHDWRLKD